MEVGVSIIICCYNSAARLPETLRHLAMQEVTPGICWEVIVVDNASTDDTPSLAVKEWEKHGLKYPKFRLLSQPEAGKNNAYNMAIRAARYEYILTCDDDNRLSPGYVDRAFNKMQGDDRIGVLGGHGIFDPEQPVQSIAGQYRSSYVNGVQSWAATEHWVYGAGSICRRSVLLDFYDKNWSQITTGRKGTKLISGEDVEICFMFYLSGYKIASDDSLTFHHFVPLQRQNLSYLLNLQYWISYSYVLLNSYIMLIEEDQRPVEDKLNKWFIHQLKAWILVTTKICKGRLVDRNNADTDELLRQRSYWGTLNSIYKNRGKLAIHLKSLRSLVKNSQDTDQYKPVS